MRFATTLLLTLTLLPGCVHTVSVSTMTPELPEALVSVPTRAWRVEEAGTHVGFVLRFDPSLGKHDRFHSVRNAYNQELGLIDAEGRWWRYRPHGEEPLWLGTGTVEDGVYEILGLDPETSQMGSIPLLELGD
ncbi:MAG: hypothetical protein ACYSWX_07020 [Planctomycetota bacterium]|jgi:hypothetical protein